MLSFPPLNGKTYQILRIAYNLILPSARQKVLTDRRHRSATGFHFSDAIRERIPCINFPCWIYSSLLISQVQLGTKLIGPSNIPRGELFICNVSKDRKQYRTAYHRWAIKIWWMELKTKLYFRVSMESFLSQSKLRQLLHQNSSKHVEFFALHSLGHPFQGRLSDLKKKKVDGN